MCLKIYYLEERIKFNNMLVNSILAQKPEIHSDYCDEDIIHLGAMTYMPISQINFRVFTVSKEHVARPDLISKFAYGDEMYADIICKMNGISNPFELNEGMRIAIPDLDDIIQCLNRDTFDDTIENETKSDKPKPKTRNEKRKANDAIVGDTRFKINKERNIIIY